MEDIKARADVDSDGGITYTEFIPVVKELLTQVYAKKDNDWNDWCKVRMCRLHCRLVVDFGCTGFIAT